MKFAFIREHKAEFPIEVLCDVLKASRSGYYAWTRQAPSPAARRRDRIVAVIREAHAASRATYGSPRVHRALEARGVSCCENTVAKLMRADGVRARTRRPFVVRTSDSRHDRPVAKNVLNREFYPDRPNAVWTAGCASTITRSVPRRRTSLGSGALSCFTASDTRASSARPRSRRSSRTRPPPGMSPRVPGTRPW